MYSTALRTARKRTNGSPAARVIALSRATIYSQPYYFSPQQIADEETDRRERLSLAAPERT